MQTWARRGVHAALVTGGMLAVGSGVASATEACQEPHAAPWGNGTVDDGTPSRSGTCYSGELFPEDDAPTGRHHLITPSRYPAVEDALTHELPAITDHQWFTPDPSAPRVPAAARPLELAGWVAEIPEQERAGTESTDEFGSPSEGFHRSMGWAGPLGAVVREAPPADLSETTEIPAIRSVPPLVVPDADLEDAALPESTDSIVALWQGSLGQAAGTPALLAPPTEDLTDGRLDDLLAELHTVPNSLVTKALTTGPTALAPQSAEFVPLHVPGEFQEQATDVPNLSRALVAPAHGRGGPGVEAPLPVLGELHAVGGGETSLPTPSRITEALEGNRLPLPRTEDRAATPAVPHVPGFSRTPEATDVSYVVLDGLRAATNELDLVVENPFRPAPAPRASAPMALPVLDGLPDLTAVQGETMPTPGIDAHPSRAVDETAPLPRVLV